MAPTMEKTLKYEMGIHGIEVKGVAFMKEGIFKYQLPHKPGAVQKDDTLAKKHIKAYGELAGCGNS